MRSRMTDRPPLVSSPALRGKAKEGAARSRQCSLQIFVQSSPSPEGATGFTHLYSLSFSSPPREWGRGLRRVSRSEAETYSELGEGVVTGKNDIFDISPVIETPLTLILSPRCAGGEERNGSSREETIEDV
jgi:hypothetical protein